MALLQISEPGGSSAPHQHRNSVGIDLGTTNSLVATVRSGEAVCLADGEERSLLPSVVHFGDQEILTGHQALSLQTLDPLNTVSSIKRMMGRGREDVSQLGSSVPYQFVVSEESNVPRIRTRSGDFSAVEISSEILKTLSRRAVQSTGGDL
ncbi:MAG: Hsp70 family protein, partial [Gammaproteobacteria bacterium]|nr:Hsp70 family protein [Gammaproteobacteria bacterium]